MEHDVEKKYIAVYVYIAFGINERPGYQIRDFQESVSELKSGHEWDLVKETVYDDKDIKSCIVYDTHGSAYEIPNDPEIHTVEKRGKVRTSVPSPLLD